MSLSEELRAKFSEVEAKRIADEEQFYCAMGRFVCWFARAEGAMHVQFAYISGLSERHARAVVGGSRLVDLVGIIQRLIDLSNIEDAKKEEIRALIKQLQSISILRHALIHSGAEIGGGKFSSWNVFTAKTRESITVFTSDVENLEHATDDLKRIALRLFIFHTPNVRDGYPEEGRKELFAPWKYKPVQRETVLKHNQKARQRSKRQPRSSGA